MKVIIEILIIIVMAIGAVIICVFLNRKKDTSVNMVLIIVLFGLLYNAVISPISSQMEKEFHNSLENTANTVDLVFKELEVNKSESKDNVNIDESKTDEISDNANKVLQSILNKPLEERYPIPTESIFPDINMALIDVSRYNNQLTGYKGRMRMPDSVTFPFESEKNDKEGLLYELKQEIVKNPLLGDMVAQGLIDVEPNIEKTNPWITDFITETNDAFNRNHSDEKFGFERWIHGYKFPDGQVGYYVDDRYRLYAEKICLLLDKYNNEGVQIIHPIEYYHRYPFFYSESRTFKADADSSSDDWKIEALVLHKEIDGNSYDIGFDLDDKAFLKVNP